MVIIHSSFNDTFIIRAHFIMSSISVREDALLQGKLWLTQPTHGYRVNTDAFLLAAFASSNSTAKHVLDLGAGVGSISLALLTLQKASQATLIEADPMFASLARANIERALKQHCASVVEHDLAHSLPPNLRSCFDLVVANPPYAIDYAVRPSPNTNLAQARVGTAATLSHFVRAARIALSRKGRACFVFPIHELARLFKTLRQVGLEPKRLRCIHSLEGHPAQLVLLEAKPARRGGLRIEPPLFIMHSPGQWTEEARAIVDGTIS